MYHYSRSKHSIYYQLFTSMSVVALVLELFYEDASNVDALALFLMEAETLQSMQQQDDFL